MKILIIKNNLPFDIDIKSVQSFFAGKIDLEFESITLNIPVSIKVYKQVQGYNPITGKPGLINYYGLSDDIKAQCNYPYDMVIFAWNLDSIKAPTDGAITSWTLNVPISPKTDYIQLAINQYLKNTDGITNRITHEIMHALCFKANRAGIPTVDEMDVTKDGKNFYKNDDPTAIDGNYARTLNNLQPYFKKITELTMNNSMPKATIIRSKSTKKETLGMLTAFNGGASFACRTLELPDLNNQKMISCIPKGTYTVKKVFWPRKLKSFYQVQNVPNRSGIFIHEGNYFFNYEGCIGLGNSIADINKDGETDILNTLATIKAFEGFMGGKEFTLEIK